METLRDLSHIAGPFIVPLVVGLITAIGLGLSATLPDRGKMSKENAEMLGGFTIFFFIVATLAHAFFSNIPDIIEILEILFGKAVEILGPKLTQIIIAISVWAIGYGAYRFKKADQYHYGLVEILVGICSAGFVADTLAPGKLELAKWSTLAGSAYVVARGLENRLKGKSNARSRSEKTQLKR